VSDQRYRPGLQRVGLGVAESAQPVADIGEAHAACPAQRHACRARDRGQAIAQDWPVVTRHAILVGVAEYDRGATPGLDRQRQLLLQRRVRDRQQR
jgi:hypothetical protein